MDIFTSAIVGAQPNGLPQQVFVTLNGSALELEALGMAIQKALAGSPQAFDARTTNGVPVRMVVDRLGPPQTQGG